MFKRFTPEARQVVLEAQEHAVRLGHDWIGCEHLLLAVADPMTPVGSLLTEKGAPLQALEEAISVVIGPGPLESDDSLLLATLGIDAEEVRQAVEATFGSGALNAARTRERRGRRRRLSRRRGPCITSPARPPFTPKAKRCLELSLRESLRRKHDHIGVEHIALALLSRDDTAAWQVLLHVGIEPDQLRRAIEELTHRPT